MTLLLGLGPEFFLQSRTLDMKLFKETMTRFKHDMRVKHYVMSMHGFENNPPPKTYFKSTSNNMPNVPSAIEGSMKSFEKTLQISVLSNKHSTLLMKKITRKHNKSFSSQSRTCDSTC